MTLLTSPPIPLRRPRSAQPPFGARLSPRFSRKAAFAIYGDSYLDLVTGKFAGDSPLTGSWSRQSVANALGPAIKTDWQANGPINPARWAWDARQDFGTGDFTVVYVGVIPSDTVSGNNLSNSGGLTNQWRFQTNYLANGTNAGTYTTTAGALSMLLYDGAFFSIGATGMCDGKPHCYVFVRRGTAHELWMDGVLKASGTSSALDVNSTKQVGIATAWQLNGTLSSGSGWYAANHTMNFAAGFREALSGASLSSDPWQLLRVADTTPRFALVRGREPVSVRESVLLPTSGPAPSEVAPVILGRKEGWVSQPNGATPVASSRIPLAMLHAPAGLRQLGRLGAPVFSGSGPQNAVPSSDVVALPHNGTSDYQELAVSISSFPFVLAVSFVATDTATAGQVAVSLGDGVNASGGIFAYIGQNVSGSAIDAGVRTSNGATTSTTTGPSTVAGKRYNAVLIVRSTTSHTLFVNGIKYTDTTDTAFFSGETYGFFSVGRVNRAGSAGNYGKQSIALAFCDNKDPGDEWARGWSTTPWKSFQPTNQPIWSDR